MGFKRITADGHFESFEQKVQRQKAALPAKKARTAAARVIRLRKVVRLVRRAIKCHQVRICTLFEDLGEGPPMLLV